MVAVLEGDTLLVQVPDDIWVRRSEQRAGPVRKHDSQVHALSLQQRQTHAVPARRY